MRFTGPSAGGEEKSEKKAGSEKSVSWAHPFLSKIISLKPFFKPKSLRLRTFRGFGFNFIAKTANKAKGEKKFAKFVYFCVGQEEFTHLLLR